MKIPESIRTSLQTGKWVTSIDFKDVSFQIQINPKPRKYLHFNVLSQSYQLKALLFGLSKFHRLPVQPKGGQGQTHSRMLADLKLENSEAYLRPYLVDPSQVEAHVPDDSYPFDNYRETSPPKSAPYEADSVAPENSLEDPRILGKGDPEPKISLSTSKMVGSRSQCPPRSATTPTQPCSSHLYRCLKRRLGL